MKKYLVRNDKVAGLFGLFWYTPQVYHFEMSIAYDYSVTFL